MKLQNRLKILGVGATLCAAINVHAYFNPQLGSWASRDPIDEPGFIASTFASGNVEDSLGQEGAGNPYLFVANDPANKIDPNGLDFIAVGDRYVRGTPGLFRHMSIEFFTEQCPSAAEGTRFTRGSQPGTRFDSFELQPLLRSYRHFLSDGAFVWDKISEIRRSSTPRDFIVIYADFDNPQHDALRQWTTIVVAATTYSYGEQRFTRGWLSRWPNSRYQLFGNNSNTFVREMARVIGRNADVIGGSHPGNIYAVPVPYPGYTPVFSPWGNE